MPENPLYSIPSSAAKHTVSGIAQEDLVGWRVLI
jgi:hypothetical protein